MYVHVHLLHAPTARLENGTCTIESGTPQTFASTCRVSWRNIITKNCIFCLHTLLDKNICFAGADSATKSRSLPRYLTTEIKNQIAYSSADEDYGMRGGGSKVGSRTARLRNRDDKKPSSGNRTKLVDRHPSHSGIKSRPSRLALQNSVNDPSLSRSHDSLVGVASNVGKRSKKPHFLPDVVKSSAHTGMVI